MLYLQVNTEVKVEVEAPEEKPVIKEEEPVKVEIKKEPAPVVPMEVDQEPVKKEKEKRKQKKQSKEPPKEVVALVKEIPVSIAKPVEANPNGGKF